MLHAGRRGRAERTSGVTLQPDRQVWDTCDQEDHVEFIRADFCYQVVLPGKLLLLCLCPSRSRLGSIS